MRVAATVLGLLTIVLTPMTMAFASGVPTGQTVRGYLLRTAQLTDTVSSGFTCEIYLETDSYQKAGTLEFWGFPSSHQLFNISAQAVKTLTDLAPSLTPVNGPGSKNVKTIVPVTKGDIDYSYIVGKQGQVGEMLDVYSTTQVAAAPTASNQRMIRILNHLCESARVAFNKRHPENPVTTLGSDAIEAANAW